VTGMNGSGKSSILEAIFLNCEASNVNAPISINFIRGEVLSNHTNDRSFKSLFNDFVGAKPISIFGHWKNNKTDTTPGNRDLTIKPILSSYKFTQFPDGRQNISGLELDFKGAGQKVQTRGQWVEEVVSMPGSVASGIRNGPGQGTHYRFSQDPPQPKANIKVAFLIPAPRETINFVYEHLMNATREKNIPGIVRMASIIDQRVTNFVPLFENGGNQVYVDIGLERLIPLTMMGAGFANMLQIAIGIVQTRSRVIIIDEIEDGLHYTTFPKIARALIDFVQESDLQLFISTHSGEFLDAFVDVARGTNFTDVCSFRISEIVGEKIVTRFDACDLDSAKNIELDVR